MVRAVFYEISCRIIQKWHAYHFLELYALKQQASEPMGCYPPDFNLLEDIRCLLKAAENVNIAV